MFLTSHETEYNTEKKAVHYRNMKCPTFTIKAWRKDRQKNCIDIE